MDVYSFQGILVRTHIAAVLSIYTFRQDIVIAWSLDPSLISLKQLAFLTLN